MTKDSSSSMLVETITLPNREDAFMMLVDVFLNGTEELREEIRQRWDFGAEWIFPNMKRLACSNNEKWSSKERIVASLVYDAIVDLREEDIKDELVTLAVIYHSCLAAGHDPHKIFGKIAAVSTDKTAAVLRDFVNRNPEDISIEAFMLSTEVNSDGEMEISPSWMK
ncbi:MAG: hypothetical protein ACYC5A_11210 [Thermoleophilia bacterium]